MKKTLSLLLTTFSVVLYNPCNASLTLKETPEIKIDTKILTALQAVQYAEAWRPTDQKEFFIEFAENPETHLDEIFNLLLHVDHETAAAVFRVYTIRSDSRLR